MLPFYRINSFCTFDSVVQVIAIGTNTIQRESLAGRKFGKYGESSLIHQIKTFQISTYNHNHQAESIHLPNFFAKCSK